MRGLKRSKGPRRPRVQTDASRPVTFSYRANRQPAEQHRATSRTVASAVRTPRNFRWQQIPSIFVSLSLLVSLAYILGLSTNPKIVAQGSRQQQTSLLRDQKVYAQAAHQILEHSIASRTKITIDTSDFDRQMRAQFPELSATAVTLPLMGRRPIVELVVARPALLLSNAKGTYIIDDAGRAVLKSQDAKSLEQFKLPVVTDQSNAAVTLGKGALSTQAVTFITTFIQQLAAQKIIVNSLTLPPSASEVQAHIDGQAYVIKASLLSDPKLAAGGYLALKQKLDSDHVTPGEYVDVRVDEKVFYK